MASPISIIGGGVIGLTTAWALVKKGHDVRLIEASDKPGSGASFANGGQLSYRYVSPLADAGIPMQALGWLMQNDAPLRLRLRMEPHQWRWLYAFLRACRASVNQQNTQRLLRLAMHSREVLTGWREQDSLADFSWRQNGKLVAFRSQSIFDHARHHLADPQAQQVLAADQLATLDPALANTPFVGGIYTAGEEVGDCYHFCLALEARLRATGQCHFITGHPVSQIIHRETQVTALRIAGNELPVDKLIICAGYQSPALALPGIRLPVYPLKGYSLSVPSEATSITPSISLTDYEKKLFMPGWADSCALPPRWILTALITPLMKSVSPPFVPPRKNFSLTAAIMRRPLHGRGCVRLRRPACRLSAPRPTEIYG